jgi:hypothetical protein
VLTRTSAQMHFPRVYSGGLGDGHSIVGMVQLPWTSAAEQAPKVFGRVVPIRLPAPVASKRCHFYNGCKDCLVTL